MKKDWLEQGLNDKLGNYESSMDLEEAWMALEAKRQAPKRKRRFLIWWFLGGILVLSLSASGYFLWEKGTMNESMDTSDIFKIEQNIVENCIETPISNPTNKELHLSGQATEDKSLNPKGLRQDIAIAEFAPNKLKNGKTRPTNTESSITATKSIANIQSKANKPNVMIKNTSNISSSWKDENQELQATTRVSYQALSETERESEMIPKLPTLNNLLEIPNIDLEKLNFSQLSTLDKEMRTKHKTTFVPQYVGVESGYGWRSKGKVLEDEKPLDVFSIHLFYQKYLNKKIYLKTGIQFSQFTNKLELDSTNTYTQVVDNQLILINEYADGTIDNVYGLAEIETIETINMKLFNQYKFLSVPIILGLELSPFKNSSFQVEAGFSTTIFSKFDGHFMGNNGLEKLENLNLKKTGILNALYAAQWNIRPFKRANWKLFLKYQGSFQWNKLSEQPRLNMEKFNAQQLFVGLKYQF